MSQLQDDIDDCLADLLRDAGEEATLARGNVSTILTLIPAARREHSLNFQTRDFLLPASTYKVSGAEVEPAPGDTITLSGRSWEVRPFEDELPFNPVQGADRVPWYRVHVKDAAWRRDQLQFSLQRQKSGAGQATQQTDNKVIIRGLVKFDGGNEGYDGRQRVAIQPSLVIVPVTRDLRGIDSFDSIQVEKDGRCRTLAIESVRDPGTQGSVLYFECNERV